ncbi:fatty acid desaturase family protein [Sphingomonas endophytica]|nr:fatty acid desaturase [Sphingomonas endophytica]
MNTITLERAGAAARPARLPIADDKAMLKAAAELTRDLVKPNAGIYWADLIGSSLVGYGALAVAILSGTLWVAIVAGIVAVLALYRGMSMIHELTHVKHASLPGFRTGWNALIGVPMMIPSFMYEGVHNLHHAKTRYGTAEDPEYLPLALMKPWTLPVFILVSALAPIGLLIRFGVLAPLSALSPALRETVIARYSALSINPQFRRRMPQGDEKARWDMLETVTAIWALALIVTTVTGVLPLKAVLVFLAVGSGVALINQVRTLVAHLWENEGEVMTVTAQYLDSVNVPPPALLPVLWAPIGLRYHALHHLLPGVPYHALAEAHRRLSDVLEPDSPYYKANYRGLPGLVGKIATATMRGR